MNTSSVLVVALLAYAVHEHQAGNATQIEVSLGPRECTVEDDGRGMGLHRAGYAEGLVEQLTGRRGEVVLHGIGLAIIAMSSPMLSIESRRGGEVHRQAFCWGRAQGPVQSEPAAGPTGTRVTLHLPPEAPIIDVDEVRAQVEKWRALHLGLRLEVRVLA